MSEEQTANQNAGDGDLNTANQNADGSGQQQTANQNTSDGGSQEDEGLKRAAVEEKKKRQAAEAEAEALRQQMLVLQANAQPQTARTQPQSIEEQVLIEMGLQDEPYMSTTDSIRFQQRVNQIRGIQNAYASFMSQHPDFNDVVGIPNPQTGMVQPSGLLKNLIKEDPTLNYLMMIGNAPAAYRLCKQQEKMVELEKQNKAGQEFQNVVDSQNKTNAMSAAAVGGSGTVPDEVTINSMSDEQFDDMDRKVMSGEFG